VTGLGISVDAVRVAAGDGFAVWVAAEARGAASSARVDAEGCGDATSDARACGEGDVAAGDCGACDGVWVASVAEETGRGVASGASVAGAKVGEGVASAADATATGCPEDPPPRPAMDSPAPITKPSTITPIKNGINGNVDAASREFCGRRERRGGISSIASRLRSARFASMRAIEIPLGARDDIEKMDAMRKRSRRT
jgi:hypothetical protein